MISFEVVDLFAEDEHPQVFAEEFYYVEGIGEAGTVAGESGELYVSIRFLTLVVSVPVLKSSGPDVLVADQGALGERKGKVGGRTAQPAPGQLYTPDSPA